MKDLQDEIVFAFAERQELDKTVHSLKYDRQQTSECFEAHVLPTGNISSNIAEELMDAIVAEGKDTIGGHRGAFFAGDITHQQYSPVTEEIVESDLKDVNQSLSSKVFPQPTPSRNTVMCPDRRPYDQHQTPGDITTRSINDSLFIRIFEQEFACLFSAIKLLQPLRLHALTAA
nr:unnamed protein product [Spirometra erinaceieuropaei]